MRIPMAAFLTLAFCACLPDSAVQDPAVRVLYHLPYTDPPDPVRRLDIYSREGALNHPVVVWIHGGGWAKGDKSAVDHKPRAFTDRGFVLVSVNYRLVPSVTVTRQAEDVARAVVFVRRNCARWGGDPERIVLMGHSAGAHLATLVSTDESYLEAEGGGLSILRGCIAVDVAAYDIPTRYRAAGPSLKKTLSTIFGKNEETRRKVSPVTHVAKGKGIPPFLVIHINVPPQKPQSEAFVAGLSEAGVAARIHSADGRGHKQLNEALGTGGDRPTRAVFEFLDSLSAR